MDHLDNPNLSETHTPQAIAARLSGETAHNYLGDFVLGAIDGAVTTFAIVAGVAGAGYDSGTALVLGMANLLADGLSMAVSNYMSTKSQREFVERVRQIERKHIDEFPEGEREEIRQIFASKGFTGELLEQIVEVITDDHRRWVDTMVTEEFGLSVESPSPFRAALATFCAFALAGFVPLAPFCLGLESKETVFAVSAIATAVTFFLIGMAKGHVVNRSRWYGGLEVLGIGGAAAVVAFFVGVVLHRIVGAG